MAPPGYSCLRLWGQLSIWGCALETWKAEQVRDLRGDERFEEMNDGLNHAIISHEGDDFAKI